MLGSNILEVGLGLALVFLFLSLMATSIREAIESVVKSRAIHLERGIREILGDPNGDGITQIFYQHPLIYSLFTGPFEHMKKRRLGRNMPAYIPAKNFALAIMDLAIRGPVPNEYAAAHTAPTLSVEALRETATRLKNPHLVRAVLSAVDHAEGDFNKARENLQAWFDSSMDRVSGRYKHETQLWLFGIGLVLAVALNINTFRITERLFRDKELRQAIASRAEAIVNDTTVKNHLNDTTFQQTVLKNASRDLAGLNLPIGWSDPAVRAQVAAANSSVIEFGKFWVWEFIGFLPAAFAVTLGAAFWFDMLNKIMVIRATVKPHEKSPEEASEDRQSSGGTTAKVVVNTGARRDASSSKSTSIIDAAAATAVGTIDPDHAPHEWAHGEPDEGII